MIFSAGVHIIHASYPHHLSNFMAHDVIQSWYTYRKKVGTYVHVICTTRYRWIIIIFKKIIEVFRDISNSIWIRHNNLGIIKMKIVFPIIIAVNWKIIFTLGAVHKLRRHTGGRGFSKISTLFAHQKFPKIQAGHWIHIYLWIQKTNKKPYFGSIHDGWWRPITSNNVYHS